MHMVKGIVLDFDGVIADSMRQHAEAYRQVLDAMRVPVADQDVFIREGARSETIISDLLKGAGKSVGAEKVRAMADSKQEIFKSLGQPSLYQGAEDMVRSLHRPGVRLGLVTGTRRENLERMIPHLMKRFDAVLSQESYTHDKPHPEPYEKAAKGLRLAPSECAALENAARGVASAKAAGYAFVVGITTTLPKEVLRTAGADLVVATHGGAAEALLDWAREDVA